MDLYCPTLATATFLLLGASAATAQTMDECEKLKIDNAKLKFENANLKKGIMAHSPTTAPPQTTEQAGKPTSTLQPAQTTTQRQTAYNVEYALVKCQGNAKAQTVTLTFLLTNSAANQVRKITRLKAVDEQGDEYAVEGYQAKLGSGTSVYTTLATGVPIKAVVVVPKILPKTKLFKLVTLTVYGEGHPAAPAGGNIDLEYRNVAIGWN
jgi:hypothetical protein